MKIFLPIILLLSLVSLAKAEKNCGSLAEYYLEIVKDDSDKTRSWLRYGYFVGYVTAFIQGDDRRYLDVPDGVTEGQLTHVVGKWLQAHPEKWHLGRSHCVFTALYTAWPNPLNDQGRNLFHHLNPE